MLLVDRRRPAACGPGAPGRRELASGRPRLMPPAGDRAGGDAVLACDLDGLPPGVDLGDHLLFEDNTKDG